MIIHIARLKKDITKFTGRENGAVLELDDDPVLRPTGPLCYDLSVQKISSRLIVQGSVHIRMECVCARCSDFFSTRIEDSAFLRDYELIAATQSVDITDDLREALLLQLPHVPVCRADCRGLCPRCGRSRNEETCDCRTDARISPWSLLDEMNL